MTIPLSPTLTISPSTLNSTESEINAEFSVYNRPNYHGLLSISGLSVIEPRIICSKPPSGVIPFHIMVSASETTHNGSGTNSAFMDLHYEWDFGDPSGVEYFTDYYNNKEVNVNYQYGPLAAYLYRNSGDYTITLTAKGKDENGNLISASTNTIFSIGEYWPFFANATGGYITLTLDGETTGHIPYTASGDSTLLSSGLNELTNVEDEDIRITGNHCIQFVKNFLGKTYSITGDFSNLTGTSGTPYLREEKIPFSGNVVNVFGIPNDWTTQYFDSNYDGSNGVSDGTEGRPYTTWSSLRTFVSSTSTKRAAYLKRNSSWVNSSDNFLIESNGAKRILDYGSGNKPIIHILSAGNLAFTNIDVGYVDKDAGNVVFSNIEISGDVTQPFLFLSIGEGGNRSNPTGKLRNVIFDNLDIKKTDLSTGGSMCFVSTTLQNSYRGSATNDIHFWGCSFDSNRSGGQAILSRIDQWSSVVGCESIGGSGNATLDHHFYPTVHRYNLFKYTRARNAYQRNFVINGNAEVYGSGHKYFVVDGCNFESPQNGIDLSNTNNSLYTGGRNGYHDDVIIQFNKLSSRRDNNIQNGVYCNNLDKITIRYNDFYHFGQNSIISGDIYIPTKFWIYNNRFYGGVIRQRQNQPFYYYNNSIYSTDATVVGTYNSNLEVQYSADFALIKADNNQWYAPDESGPIRNDQTGTYLTFANWQASGFDPNGAYGDPNWFAPESGIFLKNPYIKINWPDNFTNLEYYNNNSWESYTNNTYILLDSGINSFRDGLFRSSFSGQSGIYEVVVSSSGESFNFSEENYSVFLTGIGSGPSKFYIFGFGSNYLVLTT